MKVAVYIRVSSEEQTKGESLNTQEKMGIEFAKAQGFEYQVFRDEGLSGGEITRRGGYNDLLKVVKSKQVDMLWVFSTSRLNRDMMNQAVLMYECSKLGIPVYVGSKKYDFSNPADKFPQYPINSVETFGKLTQHTVIANCGYTKETGEAELEKGIAKLISFGTSFLANPDLPKRFELNTELNQPDRATMYGGKDAGYIDYPALN